MTKEVRVKNLIIGGGAPVTIQSMTNTKTSDAVATLGQIRELEKNGCDIARIAVSSRSDVEACRKGVIGNVKIPLVADIQFDYRLAVACADIGFDKIRFNPGNIGSQQNVREVVAACRANKVPIRVGVNGGSLEKGFEKLGKAEALVQSALSHVAVLERCGFYDIVISVKSSSVNTMIEAYEILNKRCDYPLHLGVTESGARERGIVKSAIGIGSLLRSGIGDTIRVSLTGDPVEEVRAARLILQALDMRGGVQIVSCPTCSRCNYDMKSVVATVEEKTSGLHKDVKIAIMGCVVNGPGEAADADVAFCGGGDGKGALFFNGERLKNVSVADAADEILALVEKLQ